MPEMDGVDATAQIRALSDDASASVPIIGLTAFAFTDEWQRFYDAGMNSVISKPVQQGTLYNEVHAALLGNLEPESPTAVNLQDDVLNHSTIAALTKGFSEEQANLVFEQVASDLDTQRQRAIASAGKGDSEELGRACHAIKGLAASFGGEALADLAYEVETFVAEEDSEKAFAVSLDRLDPATDAVLVALSALANSSTMELPDRD